MARRHRIFAVNNLVAECIDCRVRYDLPQDSVRPGLQEYHRLAMLTPGYSSGYRTVGYCKSILRTYFNPSMHTLYVQGMGITSIKPGEIFQLGDHPQNKALKKYAPQVECIDDLPRSTCDLDIIPLDAYELIHHTNHVGDYPYAHLGFVSPRA
jgi:hypothetical protein